jgi:ABC-type antimicrobial peptide transport system permease subunit
VSQRTREIGVRMALGADRARIIRTVVASPLREVLIGLGLGLPAAWFATQVIAAQLFEVGSRDPRIMAMASVVLVAAAVVAAVLPALRAAAIEPTKVLRGE